MFPIDFFQMLAYFLFPNSIITTQQQTNHCHATLSAPGNVLSTIRLQIEPSYEH